MSRPRVSVVTIFLDPGRFLVETIESVAQQTFAELEHILVDDGSTDGSSEVAQQAAATHPGRIRYLEHARHANLGMGRSRSAGLEVARGELVAFLDADDVWLADAVERQVAWLDRYPEAQMVIGATLEWFSWISPDREDGQRWVGHTGVIHPPILALERLHQRTPPPSMNAWMARREAIEQVGGFEASFTGMFEDQAFLYKFLLEHPAVVHQDVIDRYRQHPDSAVARATEDGTFHPQVASSTQRTFRRFALEYTRSGPWRGTTVHRDARWLHRWDRWPRLSQHLYPLRPGVVRRACDWLGRLPARLTRRLRGLRETAWQRLR